MTVQEHDAMPERGSMSRSSNLRAGRQKFSFELASAVGPLRLKGPRSGGAVLMRLPCVPPRKPLKPPRACAVMRAMTELPTPPSAEKRERLVSWLLLIG